MSELKSLAKQYANLAMNAQHWISGVLLAIPSALVLSLWGVQYDPDLHYYTTGVLHPEVQHPPLYGAFVLLLWHMGFSAKAIAWVQIGLFVASGLFLVNSLSESRNSQNKQALVLGLGVVMAFYNTSLLSESLFLSFLLVAMGAAFRWAKGDGSYLWVLAVSLGLASLTRHLAWLYIGAIMLGASFAYKGQLPWAKWGMLLGILFGFWCIQVLWHTNWQGGMSSGGRLLWDNVSGVAAESLLPETQDLLRQHQLQLYSGQRYEMRVLYGRKKLDSLRAMGIRSGLEPHEAHRKADELLGQLAKRIRSDIGIWACQVTFLRENVHRALFCNVLDYRSASFQPDHLAQDWHIADSLFRALWPAEHIQKVDSSVPSIWQNEHFWNGWTWAGLLSAFGFLAFGGKQASQLFLRIIVGILLAMFLVAGLPWQLRFAYPMFVLVAMGWSLQFSEPTPSADG
jgi:hypothetical protein